MNVQQLSGNTLNYWVARADGRSDVRVEDAMCVFDISDSTHPASAFIDPLGWVYSPVTDWSQGGPIIARERIDFEHLDFFDAPDPSIRATMYTPNGKFEAVGKSILEAAMRCFVASRFGYEINRESISC